MRHSNEGSYRSQWIPRISRQMPSTRGTAEQRGNKKTSVCGVLPQVYGVRQETETRAPTEPYATNGSPSWFRPDQQNRARLIKPESPGARWDSYINHAKRLVILRRDRGTNASGVLLSPKFNCNRRFCLPEKKNLLTFAKLFSHDAQYLIEIYWSYVSNCLYIWKWEEKR